MPVLIFLIVLITTLAVILLPVVGLGVLVFKEGESSEVVPAPPSIEVEPVSLSFTTVGTAISPAQVINVTNGGAEVLDGLTYGIIYRQASPLDGWLTPFTFSSTTAPATLTVGADPTAPTPDLPAGTYNAEIVIDSANPKVQQIIIPVIFTVAPPP